MAIALYYPWMHFQDDNWLKLALLTWDCIGRVRPKTLEDRDRELVRRLRAETDFIMEVTPSEFELMTVAQNFDEILATHEDRVVERYHFSTWPAAEVWDPYTPPQSQHDVMPASNIYVPDPRLLWVYCGESDTKMGHALRELLVDLGVAATTEADEEWLGMHPKLGSIYLAALADAMARNELLSPATDDPRMHNAVGALDRLTELLLDEHVRTPAIEDAQSAYLHVALRAVIEPDRLAEVPVAKLIKFRNGYKAELAAFREHVAGLAPELQAIAEVENLEVAQAHLEALYQAKTNPRLDELRRALRGLGVESTVGALGLKVDINVAAGTLASGVAAVAGQPVVAGALALAVVPYVAGKLAARRHQVKQSPVAYLLAADRKLAGRSLLGALR